MARMRWDQIPKTYFAGISQAAIYPNNQGGVPWTGLTDVTPTEPSRQVTNVPYDGTIYTYAVTRGTPQYKVRAYTYPPILDELVGDYVDDDGFIYEGQAPKPFSLVYRKDIHPGDDYQLHVYFNCIALLEPHGATTVAESADPNPFEWEIRTLPVDTLVMKTAHLIVDTRRVSSQAVKQVENCLYGTESKDPDFQAFLRLFREVFRQGFVVIEENEVEWTLRGPDMHIELLPNGEWIVTTVDVEVDETGTFTITDDL